MDDNSLRLIVAIYNLSNWDWTSATEYQMRYQIYPDSTVFTATPLTFRASLDEENFVDSVSPWKNIWVITFTTDKDLEGSSTVSYLAL